MRFSELEAYNREALKNGTELKGYYHGTRLRCIRCEDPVKGEYSLMIMISSSGAHSKHRCSRCGLVVDCPEGHG